MAILTRSKTQTPIIKTLSLYFFNTLLPNFSNFCNIIQRVSKIITDTIRYSQTHLVPSFHTASITNFNWNPYFYLFQKTPFKTTKYLIHPPSHYHNQSTASKSRPKPHHIPEQSPTFLKIHSIWLV